MVSIGEPQVNISDGKNILYDTAFVKPFEILYGLPSVLSW